jgi:hypothetical protein
MRFITLLLVLVTSFSHAQECIQLTPEVKTMGLSRSDVILGDVDVATLPIVFHVMHVGENVGEGSNISDAQITESLNEINKQFRKEPGSTGDGTGVDTKIEFCLAQRNPDGNPTTGITRHDLSGYPAYVNNGIAVSGLDDGMPDIDVKSIACWDVDRYVNVYVVTEINGNNGIQGYAYTGPTNNCLDGVVIRSNRVAITEFNLGKTLTHELGHYLNLLHTFANTFSCDQEFNCEIQGDRVCDTPPTTVNSSCIVEACPDALVDNYMDYTGQVCRDSYTEGQAERMHECIIDQRPELIEGLSCVPPVDFDAGLANLAYKSSFCLEQQDISVDVIGIAQNTIPIVDVILIAGGESYQYSLYDVSYGDSFEVLFEGVTVQGSFQVDIVSEDDQYEGNNTLYGVVEYQPGSLFEMDFTSGFFANEISWQLVNAETEEVIIEDGPWNAGITTRSYETCLFGGCYNLVISDAANNGMPYGGDVDLWINGELYDVDVSGDDWGQIIYQICVEGIESNCSADLDNDGVVGVEDMSLLVNQYGCDADCLGDLNEDGVVNVLDMLDFLMQFGYTDCLQGPDFFATDVTEVALDYPWSESLGGIPSDPVYYDLSGRKVPGPLDRLSPGIYIAKFSRETKKIFVQ